MNFVIILVYNIINIVVQNHNNIFILTNIKFIYIKFSNVTYYY